MQARVRVWGTYLEGVEAGDDPPVLDLAALGGVGELAFVCGTRAGAALELSAHLQREPLGVPHMCHVHRHSNPRLALGSQQGCPHTHTRV